MDYSITLPDQLVQSPFHDASPAVPLPLLTDCLFSNSP